MSLFKFKTNMKCNGCIQSVTPFLNNISGLKSWKVDLESPDKILEVEGEINADIIIEAVKKAGFTISLL
jgi:copper chaperone